MTTFQKTFIVMLGVSLVAFGGAFASASNYSDAVMGLNPLNYWRLDDTAASGTAADSGSNSVPGTYGSVVTAEAGPRPTDMVGGQPMLGFDAGNIATDFPEDGDGIESVIHMGYYAPVLGSDPWTILAWVHPDAEPINNDSILEWGNGVEWQGELQFYIHQDSQSVHIGEADIRKGYQPKPAVGEWTFLAATLSAPGTGADIALYMNGQPVVPSDVLNPDQTIDITLGDDPNNYANHFIVGARDNWAGGDFNGKIDEVAIFDYALSPEQVEGLWGAAAVPEPATLTLLALGAIALLIWRRGRRT